MEGKLNYLVQTCTCIKFKKKIIGTYSVYSFKQKALGTDNDLSLKYMDETLKHLLQHWFGIGTLNLERITWESSALAIL